MTANGLSSYELFAKLLTLSRQKLKISSVSVFFLRTCIYNVYPGRAGPRRNWAGTGTFYYKIYYAYHKKPCFLH